MYLYVYVSIYKNEIETQGSLFFNYTKTNKYFLKYRPSYIYPDGNSISRSIPKGKEGVTRPRRQCALQIVVTFFSRESKIF
jgi:hypothetical protein